MHTFFLLFMSVFFFEPLMGQIQRGGIFPNVNKISAWNRESVWLMPIKSHAFRKCACSEFFGSHHLLYIPQKPSLDVVKYMPYNAETPEKALIYSVTPSENVYVRTNFDVPDLSEDHMIYVEGAVQHQLTLTIDALKKMPQKSVIATMECAGNDRLGMHPMPVGEPWRSGALSTIKWTGVSLATILGMAGVSDEAVEVLFTAADIGPREDADGDVRFTRALPIGDALLEDTLLVLSMNDEPLKPEHGFPIRLVVPGWYGMASVKWVTRIEVTTKPFKGYFQTKRYVYNDINGIKPVDRILVKSIITSPENGERISRHATISGWAWSGFGSITLVEIAIEGGEIWYEAKLGKSDSKYAWTPWSLNITFPHPGRFAIRTRATDSSGAIQPDQIVWNQLGYGNNAIRHIIIDVD